jgi:hypothetical protein
VCAALQTFARMSTGYAFKHTFGQECDDVRPVDRLKKTDPRKHEPMPLAAHRSLFGKIHDFAFDKDIAYARFHRSAGFLFPRRA